MTKEELKNRLFTDLVHSVVHTTLLMNLHNTVHEILEEIEHQTGDKPEQTPIEIANEMTRLLHTLWVDNQEPEDQFGFCFNFR